LSHQRPTIVKKSRLHGARKPTRDAVLAGHGRNCHQRAAAAAVPIEVAGYTLMVDVELDRAHDTA
jgi:hypothetical protein